MRKFLFAALPTTGMIRPLSVILVAALTGAFWVATNVAGEPNCIVCHKRTQTLAFPCNSLDYRRHLDHGDPMGPCAVTPAENP